MVTVKSAHSTPRIRNYPRHRWLTQNVHLAKITYHRCSRRIHLYEIDYYQQKTEETNSLPLELLLSFVNTVPHSASILRIWDFRLPQQVLKGISFSGTLSSVSWYESPHTASKYSETSARTTRQNGIASHKTESFSIHDLVIWNISTWGLVYLQQRFGEIPSPFRKVVRYILPKYR